MPTIRSLPLSSVKSLSSSDAAALKRIGIDSTKELLAAAKSPTEERALAKKAGISTAAVREAINRADLLNVKGIGKSMADLFENAGVNSAKELAQRNPDALVKTLKAYVQAHPDQGSWLPSSAAIKSVVENAKTGGTTTTGVSTWGEAQTKAASALDAYIDDVLFSTHPDGANFRTQVLGARPQSEWPAVQRQMHTDAATYLREALTPPATSGATKTETPTHFNWEGAVMGLYTEVQVNKATGKVDKVFVEID